MKAAVLLGHGAPPRYEEFPEPQETAEAMVVSVLAAGVNHVDLAKASGTFYTGPPPVPSVVGSDGVGVAPDGRRVYFDAPLAPFGTMADRALIARPSVFDVAEGVDDVTAAALGNSGVAAWLALEWRAGLRAGETVLVLGATGAVGQVAVQAAQLLGAGRVVAAGRDAGRLRRCAQLGADAVVELGAAQELSTALHDAAPAGFDVIVDLLWGPPALAAMRAAAPGARFVQVGQLAGPELALPAPLLRALPLTVTGHANFHAAPEVRAAAYALLTEHAAGGRLRLDTEVVPLAGIEHAWARQAAGAGVKLVVVP